MHCLLLPDLMFLAKSYSIQYICHINQLLQFHLKFSLSRDYFFYNGKQTHICPVVPYFLIYHCTTLSSVTFLIVQCLSLLFVLQWTPWNMSIPLTTSLNKFSRGVTNNSHIGESSGLFNLPPSQFSSFCLHCPIHPRYFLPLDSMLPHRTYVLFAFLPLWSLIWALFSLFTFWMKISSQILILILFFTETPLVILP